MSSAMAIKRRTGQISLAQRAVALAMVSTLAAERFTVLAVSGGQFRAAAKCADHHGLGLRAGDALHFATAPEPGAMVHTHERRVADAGPILGVPMQLMGDNEHLHKCAVKADASAEAKRVGVVLKANA